MKLVNIESPYAADTPEGIEKNVVYARACMADCLARGEAPIASHILYTQPGILRDSVREERRLGIEAGLAWNQRAEATVVYVDLGITSGMLLGVEHAELAGRPVAYRRLSAPDVKTP